MNGKNFRRKIRTEKVVPLLPGAITTAALCFGLLSMGASVQIASSGAALDSALAWRAAAFIAAAMACDLIDGRVARAFGIDGRFGVIYDSLSDAVCFGAAPALVVYSLFGDALGSPVLNIGLLIYAVCAALRLARFNMQSFSRERKSFMGLPSPMAAGVMISPVLAAGEIGVSVSAEAMGIFYAAIAPITGFFMVSGIRYPKIGLLSLGRLGGGRKFDFLVTLSVIMAVAAASPGICVAVVSVLYLFSGPLFFAVRAVKFRRARSG